MNSKKGSRFRIILARQPDRYIESFNRKWRERMLAILEDMAVNPFSGDIETIKGKRGYYRRRVGGYRLKFTVNIESREVHILEIGPRGDFDY
jgi:mRNA-degrading endonuclease RelE of RelBE toxin-antitoxin system